MKFWDDGQPESTRIRNVKFSWEKLKKFTSFLIKNGIDAKCTLYDFSPEQIILDSNHIPYPIGVYKKAEKTNIILKEQKEYDFFMMVDCDAFFDDPDYEKFLEIFINLNNGDVVTFDLAKLNDNVNEYIIDNKFNKEKADWSYAYSGNKSNGPLNGYIGGLGGVYLCDTKLLLELGGFDESYVGWGGEDGDMLSRIWSTTIHHTFKPIRNFAPFHLPHFSDWGNKLYNERFNNE
jgi:predicted glycosyltransferase involved in capsule biosynthesis